MNMSLKNKWLPAVTANVLALITVGIPALTIAQASTSAPAATDSVWERDQLTGDWGGLRSDLAKHGLDIEIRNSHFVQKVTSGGANPDADAEYGVKLDTFVNIDASKLFGSWDGLYISAHIESRDGNDVLADAGGVVLPNTPLMYPLPGNYDGTDVTSFFATQMLFDGKAAVLAGKLGSMDVLQGLFPHAVDYGMDGFMNANSMMSILSWGRWLTLSQYGVAGWTYAHDLPSTGFIIAGHDTTTTTWDVNDSFSDGVGVMVFHRFVYNTEKLGYVYVGGGGSTKDYVSTDPVDWTILPGVGIESDKEDNPWDLAVYVYQEFWHHADDKNRRAHFFVGGTVGDDNPSFSDWDVFANFQAFGPFDARPHDRMGFAAHYYHFADDIVSLVSEIPSENMRDDSWTLEAFYNYQITPWLHATPSIQYAQNASKSDDPGVIPGIRLVIDL